MSRAQDQKPKTEAPNDVAAIILAAGRSQRMGAFKPLLKFGNSTVVEHSIQSFRDAGIDAIVIVVGHRAAELQEHLRDSSVTFITNPESSSEMSQSIRLAVQGVPDRYKAVAITPVDNPAVPASVISQLLESWRAGAKLVVPEFAGRGGHPVIVDLSFRQDLLSLDKAAGLRGFLRRHSAEMIRPTVDSPYIARDLDTWDDYRAMHQELFGYLPEDQSVTGKA